MMSLEQFSGFILICLMIGIVFMATRFVSSVRHNGKDIYFITINAWFRGHHEYQEWLKNNTVYHWCVLLVMALCPTILFLIKPFSRGHMFVRPEMTLYTNILLWTAIFATYRWFFKATSSIKKG